MNGGANHYEMVWSIWMNGLFEPSPPSPLPTRFKGQMSDCPVCQAVLTNSDWRHCDENDSANCSQTASFLSKWLTHSLQRGSKIVYEFGCSIGDIMCDLVHARNPPSLWNTVFPGKRSSAQSFLSPNFLNQNEHTVSESAVLYSLYSSLVKSFVTLWELTFNNRV